MNHVPPLFGRSSSAAVAANAGRSVKPIFERLDRETRPIADLHSHILIRAWEPLQSRNQLEHRTGSFELLLHQVIVNA